MTTNTQASERSISVQIAGRAYPLTVQHDEEENVRRAALEIDESMGRLKGSYPLTDRQDLLAMAALEVAARAMNSARAQEHAEALAALDELDALLAPPPRS